jgi:NTE family protein
MFSFFSKIIFLFFALLVLYMQEALAQKVAVVLSGGGSKGAAHIGVLKALEDNHIPIDYIAGTSMGAIVGSFYAAGYSPDEIAKIIESEDAQSWADGKIEDKYIYYFKEKDPNAGWVNLKFNYDSIWQYKLPTHLISPFQVDFGLMYFLASASAAANNNFDSLYIPFRCVASDIAEKKAIVFKSGNLPETVRASMAYPFYYKPLKLDGKLLFDGGMYNNFPSDIANADFKPDYIIGSNVSANSTPPDENDIISQIENMLVSNTNYSIVCEHGVMIEPVPGKSGEFDFSGSAENIKAGYDATVSKISEIRLFVKDSVSQRERDSIRANFNKRKPQLVFDSIYIDGINKFQSLYIKNLLSKRAKHIPADKLKEEYCKLLADDKIESIYPRAIYNSRTHFYDLQLNVKRNKNFVAQIGGIISSSPISGAFLNLEYRYLGAQAMTIGVNGYLGKFYSSVQVQSWIDFPSRIPFYWKNTFTYNQWDYFKTTIRFFEDKKPSYLIENESHYETDFGLAVRNKGKIEFGAAIARMKDTYYQTNNFLRTDTADRTFFDLFTARVKYDRKTLNARQYAYNGTYLSMEFKYVLGKEENKPGSTSLSNEDFIKNHQWFLIKVQYDNYFAHAGPWKIGFYIEGLYSNKSVFHNYTSTVLSAPAFEPTPESKTLFLPNYRANAYAAGGIKNIFTIYKKIQFRLEGYIFQPYQVIQMKEDLTADLGKPFNYRYYMASAVLLYHSPMGPISLSANYYPESQDPWQFMFNIGFIIFNRKALD